MKSITYFNGISRGEDELEERSKAEQIKDEIVDELREVQNEYAQLSELDELEHDYAQKLVEAMKLLQKHVDVALEIEQAVIKEVRGDVEEAQLIACAVVVMKDKENSVISKSLSEFEPRDILKIVRAVTPELKRVIKEKKEQTSERVDLIERILKEMKKASSGIKKEVEEEQEEDLVESSIASG